LGSGLVVVLIRKLRATEHAGTIYGSLCFYSILFALPLRADKLAGLPAAGHGTLLAAAVIVGISQLVMTNAYRTLPVSQGSSIQMLLPLVTSAGAFWFFGERFTATELAGAALTLFATWRVAVPRRSTGAAEEKENLPALKTAPEP